MEGIDFTPPQDLALERSVVAELFAQPDEFVPIATGVLSPDAFTHEKHREVYEAIVKMSENRETIDLITITQRVDRNFFYKEIAGAASFTDPDGFLAHCCALRTIARRRRLFYACLKGVQIAISSANDDDEIAAFPIKLGEELDKDLPKSNTQSITDAINDLGKTLASGVVKRVPFGTPSLDRLTYGGAAPGDLVVLAARPSVGKTAVMLQMMRAAARAGFPALGLSLEMTNEELAQRMIFSTDRITARDIAWNQVDWTAFEAAAKEFDGLPIYFDEEVQTIDDVCSTITLNVRLGRCKVAYVDYLQLMSIIGGGESVNYQIAEATKRLKRLAKKLRIPIIILAQLNRKSASENRPPQLYDLRDSGAIEQDADKVIMLDNDADDKSRVNAYLRKQRGGLGGDITIPLHADRNYANFYEIADLPDEELLH